MELPSKLMESFNKAPINHYLGFKIVSRTSESAVIQMEPKQEFMQEEGVIHGAILAAIADTAAVYLFHPDLAEDMTMTSIEFKLNFLAPGLITNGALTARSSIVRKGRTIGVSDVEVLQGERLLAKGLFTYLFFKRIPNKSSGG